MQLTELWRMLIKVSILTVIEIERRTIVLEKKDVQSPLKRGTIISSKTNTFNYEKWYRASFGAPSFEVSNRRNVHDELSSDESEEDLNINAAFSIKDRNSSKHKILHFIPSAQMKILKGILVFAIF